MHEKCPKKWGHGRPASALYIEDRSGIRTCPGTVLLGGKKWCSHGFSNIH